jgi:predicted Rossmann-fold nucleotide-binding protein
LRSARGDATTVGMSLRICVFASSSEALAARHTAAAESLGAALARGGHTLVFGGCHLGLMGVLARAVQAGGGRVVGVIPEELQARGRAFPACDELAEALTLRLLGLQVQPVVVVDSAGYWAPLLALLEHLAASGATTNLRELYAVAPGGAEAVALVEAEVARTAQQGAR